MTFFDISVLPVQNNVTFSCTSLFITFFLLPCSPATGSFPAAVGRLGRILALWRAAVATAKRGGRGVPRTGPAAHKGGSGVRRRGGGGGTVAMAVHAADHRRMMTGQRAV
jgi:hypothetical protein